MKAVEFIQQIANNRINKFYNGNDRIREDNNKIIYSYYATDLLIFDRDKNEIILNLSYNSIQTTKRLNYILYSFNLSYDISSKQGNYIAINTRDKTQMKIKDYKLTIKL